MILTPFSSLAKNITLAGIKSLTVNDHLSATMLDLATNFFLTQEHVSQSINRAEACAPRLGELNPYAQSPLFHSFAHWMLTFLLSILATRPSKQPPTTSPLSSSPSSMLSRYRPSTPHFYLLFFLHLTIPRDLIAPRQTVVIVNYPHSVQLRVGDYCHAKGIYFISTECRGAFTTAFVDFGTSFEIADGNGEEVFTGAVAGLTSGGVVSMLPKMRHGLINGNAVKLLNVQGISGLGDRAYPVEVISPYDFQLKLDDGQKLEGEFVPGTATWSEVKVPFTVSHQSLRQSAFANPAGPEFALVDFLKLDGSQLWVAFCAIHLFADQHVSHSFPRPWNTEDYAQVLQNAKQLTSEPIDEKLLKQVTYTFQGQLVGLTALLGGLLGQEVLKSLSGKFTPLNQWIAIDVRELIPDVDAATLDVANFTPIGHRSDSQSIIIGRDLSQRLGEQKVFMIGSGAIGCEMMKNFAMMGVGVKAADEDHKEGRIFVTDNDLIEKSNLNRQFLFRQHNIGQAKSQAASQAIVSMNPDIVVEAHQNKVGADTEKIYTNKFWSSLDVVVNALDNIPARLYVDGKCVENQRPLVESGTMGTKGNVQVIIPHKSASYGSTRDPPEAGIPLCTLKSFPSQIEHTIQWARDKWTTLFGLKPEEAHGILNDANSSSVNALLEKIAIKKPSQKDFKHVHQLFVGIPLSFEDCVYQARRKFETYYVNAIKQLLHAFPLDHKNKEDGTLFWALPRRPPAQILFDATNVDHLDFIIHAAHLYATAYRIVATHSAADREWFATTTSAIVLPAYVVKDNHHIETNEAVTKDNAASSAIAAVKPSEWAAGEFEASLESLRAVLQAKLHVDAFADEFEKDNDANHHIDFITAASNIRAVQYGIQPVDRMRTKFVAGKIIPAMATSTAAITGLASIELIKLVKKEPDLATYKNAWMNLALPSLLLTEPQEVEKTKVSETVSVSIWDRWEVDEGDMVLGQFILHFKRKYKLVPTAIIQNTTLVYAAILGGKKALPQRMTTLLTIPEGTNFIDLTVQFETLEGVEVKGAPVRFIIAHDDTDGENTGSESESDSSSDSE